MRYVFAECILDTQLYTLHRAGTAIALQPKTFHVLQYLLEHRDHVVTRDDLITHVWDGRAIEDATVDSCIKQARRALGDSGRTQRLIESRRGYGYRFVGVVVEEALETPASQPARGPCLAEADPEDGTRAIPQAAVSAAMASRTVVELRLPVTGAPLVGRAQEVERLDRLWAGGQVNICSIVALGGVGKSALVNHWVGMLARDGWRGAARVFGWTFYSQGVRETEASADGFMEAALRFFGDPDPRVGTPWDKGQRLARCVQAQRTLLLLDGLEPLQHPPGPEAGKVKDLALASFLQAIARHNPGLCVITTRLAVTDLHHWSSTTAVLQLDALTEEAGAELLHTLGVDGSDAERRAASREYAGHALALQLLGTYLRDVCGGDVDRRREIAQLDNWAAPSSPAWCVMASYERWLGQGPEVAVLRLMGLFDGIAHADELAVLRATPTIPDLNEALLGLDARQWVHALRRLRTAGLLAPPDPLNPHSLDAHPLVREYYRHQLCTRYPTAWRAGHARLFRHLQQSVVEAYPATLEALRPLYAAVTHGCLAGRGQAALRVFRHRINRGEQQFSLEQLGAFGADVAALASFFVVPWSTVMAGFRTEDQLFLFEAVGECLSALGRVSEAEEPLQHALTLAHRHAHWTIAAHAATKLSEVYRARGDLRTALRFAHESHAHGSRPGVPAEVQVLSHAFLGFTLHWVGQGEAAHAMFQAAERLQQQATPARPLLHAVPGYMYSELLLDRLASQAAHLTPAQCAQAWRVLHTRLARALAWANQDQLLCDMGLHHIAMARVYTLAWQHQVEDEARTAPPQEQAATHIAEAVEYLRRSNHRNYVPRALLTRAALSRLQGQFARAHQDVEEAIDIAQSSTMVFYLADAYLEKASIHVAAAQVSACAEDVCQAFVSLDAANALMDKMGYARRRRQMAELEALLQSVASHCGA